ncbi:MAG TPA: metal-dependent hydrolase [Polyangia bacterium]|nr:metal-dependent hydrolase [Polyangia bacterium]
MASFGHLAVGMLTGQLHGAAATHHPKRQRYLAFLLFAAFAILPDADLILVALGGPDSGAIGHRGASHSLVTAVAVGVACGLLLRRRGVPAIRTAIAITIAVGSHGLLDTIGEGGRGIPLLWPFSDHRFLSPWRLLPDAPRVEDYLSHDGAFSLLVEFCYFLPLMAYVLWPRKKARRSHEAPVLALVKGSRPDTPPAGVGPRATGGTDEGPEPIRSSG